jgi:hypothetical protein
MLKSNALWRCSFYLGGERMLVISKEELIGLGYGKYQAEDIIRRAKAVMVSKGYSYYQNRRLGRVPISSVEEVLGIELNEIGKEVFINGQV